MVKIRKVPPNEGTKGRGTKGTHPTTVALGLETTKGTRRPRKLIPRSVQEAKLRARAPASKVQNFKKAVAKEAEEKLTEMVLKGEHPLSFTVFERFQMREMRDQGYSQVEIAQRFQTSLPIVGQILHMKERLTKAREAEITKQFFAFSKALDQIFAGVSEEKIKRASFSQLALGMGISFDKMLAARKALDGDAPDRHQHEVITGTYAERQGLLEKIQGQMLRLKEEGLVEIPGDQVSEVRTLPASTSAVEETASGTQIELFQGKEPE